MTELGGQGLPYERLQDARIAREFAQTFHDKLSEVNQAPLDTDESAQAAFIDIAQWYDRETDGIEHILGRTVLRLTGPGIGVPRIAATTNGGDDNDSDTIFFHAEMPKRAPWGEQHDMMAIEGLLSGFRQVAETNDETEERKARFFMTFRASEPIRFTMAAGDIPVVDIVGYPHLLVKPNDDLEIESPVIEAYEAREETMREISALDGGDEMIHALYDLEEEYTNEQDVELVDIKEPAIITSLGRIGEKLHDEGAEAYLVESAILRGLNESRFFDVFGLEYDLETHELKDVGVSIAGHLAAVMLTNIDSTVPTPVMVLENRVTGGIHHMPMKYVTRLRF